MLTGYAVASTRRLPISSREAAYPVGLEILGDRCQNILLPKPFDEGSGYRQQVPSVTGTPPRLASLFEGYASCDRQIPVLPQFRIDRIDVAGFANKFGEGSNQSSDVIEAACAPRIAGRWK